MKMMNKQEIEKAIWELEELKNQYWESRYYTPIETAISALQQQLNNGWIPVSERLPEPKEWCWVWFDYDEDGHSSGNGFCEKMYLSSNGKWMKNTLSTVKDEYMDCIRAWQPYFEPEPYKEDNDAKRN